MLSDHNGHILYTYIKQQILFLPFQSFSAVFHVFNTVSSCTLSLDKEKFKGQDIKYIIKLRYKRFLFQINDLLNFLWPKNPERKKKYLRFHKNIKQQNFFQY